jgi:hypothetical protein
LKEKLNARAVVLLDPMYIDGDATNIAGVKTPEVQLSLDELSGFIKDFAANTKQFLKNIRIDDTDAPRTVYISTNDRRIYLFHFKAHTRSSTESFSIYLGITVKKDLDAIKGEKENPWETPQFVFDNAWETIKEIQQLYTKFL